MKKLLVFVVLICAVNVSCKKDKKEPPENRAPMSYEILGLEDIEITEENTYAYLGVSRADTLKEFAGISISGLPEGLSASLSQDTGTTPFASLLTFKAQESLKAGTYPLRLVLKDRYGRQKEFTMKARVQHMEYLVTLTDRPQGKISVLANTVSYAYYNIDYRSGFKQKVQMAVLGLPAGVTAKFTLNDQKPHYQTVLEINTNGAAKGVYPVTIQSTASSGQQTTFPTDLHIVDECSPAMQGYYGKSTKSINGGTPALIDLPLYSGGGGSANKMYIDRIGEHLEFVLDCDRKTLEVGKHYSYMTGDTILSGTGTYTLSPKMLKINCLAKTTAGATYTIEYVLNQ